MFRTLKRVSYLEIRIIRRSSTDKNENAAELLAKKKESFDRLIRNSHDWRPVKKRLFLTFQLQRKVYEEFNRQPEKEPIPTYIPPLEPGELEEPVFRGDSSMNILEPLSSRHYVEVKQSKSLELQQRKEVISASGWALGKGRRKTALAIARIRERTWPFRLDEIPQALQLPGLERVREVEPLFTTIAGAEIPDSKDRAIGEFVPEYEHDSDHPDAIEFIPTEMLPRVAGDGVVYTEAELERARQLHENTKERLSARQRKRLESAGLDFDDDDEVSQADLELQFAALEKAVEPPPPIEEPPILPDTRVTLPYFGAASKAPKTIQEAADQLNRAAYFVINGRPFEHYFIGSLFDREIVMQPLLFAGVLQRFDIQVYVKGSGVQSQAKAVRQAIARAISFYEPDLRPILKHAGLLKGDLRQVERKKTGQPKARKKKQWSKR